MSVYGSLTNFLFIAISVCSLAVWLYLVLLRGGFWRADTRLEADEGVFENWPAVSVLVPARNEEIVISEALRSLLTQDYPGNLKIILIDDDSSDSTVAIARATAEQLSSNDRLIVVTAEPPNQGWAGKLWALNQGFSEVCRRDLEPQYLWLSDADIVHGSGTLRLLVTKAEREHLDLVSLMVLLSCKGVWERLLIPPFVFFFQKLYPFSWVADADRSTAAAAGGCILVKAEALLAAGGFDAIRGAIIDDCALAKRIKQAGLTQRLWLGLAQDSRSVRHYQEIQGIWNMVARSAYSQLRRSPLLLVGTLVGMTLTYLVPPAVALSYYWHNSAGAALAGALAWAFMVAAFLPTLRLYRQSIWQAFLLPISALFYTAMTLDSALRHWRGQGGAWKGRVAVQLPRDGAERH